MKELRSAIGRLLAEKGRCVLVIEGPCASGKTTLAARLAALFGGELIHGDDFFLRSEQRTPQRLAEVGGNFDRERFAAEVVAPLADGASFSYRPYRCSTGTFGEAVKIEGRGLVVVEGSYTLHPDLGHYYDLALFLCVSPEEQRKRLRKRSPELLSRFETEWIPKENAYAKKFSIRERCHFAWESESLLWE